MPDAVVVSNIIKRFPVDSTDVDPQIRGGFFYAIDDVSFRITSGSCALICGANGSGKSLLMSMIAALEAPDSGTVHTAGRVGLIFQDADSQILGETPREDVAFGVRNLGIPKNEVKGINTAGQALHPLPAAAFRGKPRGIKPFVSSLARSCPCKHVALSLRSSIRLTLTAYKVYT